ncbi:MAG: DUF7221 family queuine tRNA-ribosyltransferase-like protein [Solirubrobacteraceae bacterium]
MGDSSCTSTHVLPRDTPTRLAERTNRAALPLTHPTTRSKETAALGQPLGADYEDSQGELANNGGWITTVQSYINSTRRYAARMGNLQWAAPMDWICDPQVLARTGLPVQEHQRNTVENFIELRTLAPDLPYIPVIQGWTLTDYLHCVRCIRQPGST